MNFSFVALGLTPTSETEAELGKDPLYLEHAETQSKVYKRMLERHFPNAEKVIAMFLMKGVPTLHGMKRDLYLAYDRDDPKAEIYAKHLLQNLPKSWDKEAKYELEWYSTKARLLSRLQLGELTIEDIPSEYQQVTPPRYIAMAKDLEPVARLRMPTMRAAAIVH